MKIRAIKNNEFDVGTTSLRQVFDIKINLEVKMYLSPSADSSSEIARFIGFSSTRARSLEYTKVNF